MKTSKFANFKNKLIQQRKKVHTLSFIFFSIGLIFNILEYKTLYWIFSVLFVLLAALNFFLEASVKSGNEKIDLNMKGIAFLVLLFLGIFLINFF